MSRLHVDSRTPSASLRRLALAGAASLLTVLVAGGPALANTSQTAAKPAAAKPAAAKPAKGLKAPACYSRAEHAAEQTIRMHTEMMVVGLSCREVMPEHKPFDLYQSFTVKNRATISGSEAALMKFFNKNGGNGTRQFDTFRTELANEISRRAATIGTANYCQTFVERSKVANDLNAAELKTLTSDPANAGIMHLASRPLCDVQLVSTPDAAIDVAQAPAQVAKAKAKPVKTAPAKPKQKTAAAGTRTTVAENAKR